MPVRARCNAALSLRIYSAVFEGMLFLPTMQILGFSPGSSGLDLSVFINFPSCIFACLINPECFLSVGAPFTCEMLSLGRELEICSKKYLY